MPDTTCPHCGQSLIAPSLPLYKRLRAGIAERYERIDYGSYNPPESEEKYITALAVWLNMFSPNQVAGIAATALNRYFSDPNGWRRHRSLKALAEYPGDWAGLNNQPRKYEQRALARLPHHTDPVDAEAARDAMQQLKLTVLGGNNETK